MKLNFRKIGEGSPLVILHGLFGASDNWLSVAKQLSEKYTLYLIDERNHGRSPHSDEMNYKVMAEDLEEFFKEEGLEKANVMGHSMGGKAAMFFAMKYPQRIEKLIIVDIGPQSYPVHHGEILKGFAAIDPAKVSSRKEADELMKQYVPQLGVRQFLLKNLSRKDNGSYEWLANIEVIDRNIEKMGEGVPTDSTYEGSTMFINGEKSDYIKESDKENIRELFPKATMTTIQDAGHWVHAEKPEAFLQTVLTYLED